MNSDIIYEILKFLHLSSEENGGALLAKKILISGKKYQNLESRNLEKPLIFEIIGSFVKLDLGLKSVIYCDGILSEKSLNMVGGNHIIKVFDNDISITMPK